MPKKCLTPNCEFTVRARGLCVNCYADAVRYKTKEKLSWHQMVSKGLAIPKRRVLGTEKRVLKMLLLAWDKGLTRTVIGRHITIKTCQLKDMVNRWLIESRIDGKRTTYYYKGAMHRKDTDIPSMRCFK